MFDKFRTVLIGGDSARKAAQKIGEFDYLIGQKLSVSSFINPQAENHYVLVNSGRDWYDLPIFNTIQESIEYDSMVNSVSIHFNAKHVLDWVKEVVQWSQIKTIVILAEDVPEKDGREIVYLAKKYQVSIIGPSSLGVLTPGQGRIGEIGGDWKNLNLCHFDRPGGVGIITKSGTISGELSWVVSQNTSGISAVVQIGGDTFPATDYTYWLEKFALDSQTKVVVMAGEVGGDLEERAAKTIVGIRKKKPDFKVICVISGKFLEIMPKGQKFGHAGAKQEESGFGSTKYKITALREAGAEVVEFEMLGERLKELSENTYG